MAHRLDVMLWFGLFAFASSSMVICNKLIMHQFPNPNALLLIQNGITVILTLALAKAGIFDMKPWKLEHMKIWLGPVLVFSVMLMTSLKALPHIAVATTVIFRNVSTLVVAVMEPFIFGTPKPSRDRVVALGVIFCGAMIYAYFDLNYEPDGYMWITFNTILFVGLVFLEKYAVVSVDQTSTGTACYMNVLSLPMLLVGVSVAGEEAALAQYKNLTVGYQALILISGGLGCLLSICYISLNQLSNVTSITIAGNLNKLLSSVLGAYIFANKVTIHTLAGLLVCSYGGYMYSQAPKTDERIPKKDQELDSVDPAEESLELMKDIEVESHAHDEKL